MPSQPCRLHHDEILYQNIKHKKAGKSKQRDILIASTPNSNDAHDQAVQEVFGPIAYFRRFETCLLP